jgi:hypothetical protein
MGSSGGSTNGTGGTESAGTCALVFTFTTVDNMGAFSPRNVSAVWVTDSHGAFVRTLEENGYVRQFHLTAWEQSSNGSTVDAVTGATNQGPRTHDASWNCLDASGGSVLAGTYTLNAEFATDNGGFFGPSPPLLQAQVPVGSGPRAVQVPDAMYFKSIQIALR